MNNLEKLEILRGERTDAERDLIKEQIKLDILQNVGNIPDEYQESILIRQGFIAFFQQKMDYLDLKIEELNDTINNT